MRSFHTYYFGYNKSNLNFMKGVVVNYSKKPRIFTELSSPYGRYMATEMKSDFGESLSMYHIKETRNIGQLPITRTPSFSQFNSLLLSKENPINPYYSYKNHIREHISDIYKRTLRDPLPLLLLSDWMDTNFLWNDLLFKLPNEEEDGDTPLLFSYTLSSTLKKRKKKMNKHKYQKLRKRMRALRRRLGK
jgi:hypothetical protein